MKLDFPEQIFKKKYAYVKFHENLCSGSQVIPCGWIDGQTDRHDEANTCF